MTSSRRPLSIPISASHPSLGCSKSTQPSLPYLQGSDRILVIPVASRYLWHSVPFLAILLHTNTRRLPSSVSAPEHDDVLKGPPISCPNTPCPIPPPAHSPRNFFLHPLHNCRSNFLVPRRFHGGCLRRRDRHPSYSRGNMLYVSSLLHGSHPNPSKRIASFLSSLRAIHQLP